MRTVESLFEELREENERQREEIRSLRRRVRQLRTAAAAAQVLLKSACDAGSLKAKRTGHGADGDL